MDDGAILPPQGSLLGQEKIASATKLVLNGRLIWVL
jgi:hypothetical protein